MVFNFRKFYGLILQFQLLQKVRGADVGRSESDADIFTSNEDLK
jgi:hypothetical protein